MSWLFWLLVFEWLSRNHRVTAIAPCVSQSSVSTFRQLDGCTDDYTNTQETGFMASSLLACAASCASNNTCQEFNYFTNSEGLSFNCAGNNKRALGCTDLFFSPGAKYYQKSSPSCTLPWRQILSQKRGEIVSGSISTLIRAIVRGSQLRILIEGSRYDNSSLELINADAAWVAGNTVVAEMFTFVLSSIDFSRPVWAKLRADTLGMVRFVEYDFGTYDFVANITWYMRETELACNRDTSTLLKMDPDGTIHQGSINEVMSTIKDGFPVQLVEKRGENEWGSFPILRAVVEDPSRFYLFGVWISTSLQTSSLLSEMRIFQNLPHYIYVSFTNLDIMNASSVSQMNYNEAEITLVGDFCWEKVYAHDENGNPKFGTFNELDLRVRQGSDIRAAFKCDGSYETIALSLDRLDVTGNLISAFAANSFDLPIAQPFNWIRYEIHTNGSVNKITLYRSDGSEVWDSCQAQIFWFADKHQREVAWFFDQALMQNSADYMIYPTSHLYKGLMPRVHMKHAMDSNNYYNLQKMTTKNEGILGFSYRHFNGSSLELIIFYTDHFVDQFLLNVNVEPGAPSHFFSYALSINWFI